MASNAIKSGALVAYHCGFNFIIEALSKKGVPVLAKWQCINGLTKALMQSMEGIFGELELEFVLMRKEKKAKRLKIIKSIGRIWLKKAVDEGGDSDENTVEVEVVKYGGVRDTESQHEHVRQLDIGGDYGAVFVGWKCQLSQDDVGGSCGLGCLEITIERMGNDKECHKRTYISSFVPRLQEYSLETAIAVIADQGATLKVDTQHLRELSFRIGSIFQFIGELNIQPNNEAILQARTGRNVDGQILEIAMRGRFFARPDLTFMPPAWTRLLCLLL
ncbi:CST complex subunit TEN1-like [Gossypium australe]|uniref:CST complex subunit TEN1-like n=1 Tax=Gossypium australe TaxID=47621 RepID=A0A5B6W4S7_9ROSI|nr:CST complex subunit TEN1-like [Gossypium australe]